MPSERMRRQLDRLLDEAEAAVSADDWPLVANKARAALAIEAENADALMFLKMAEANLGPSSSGVPPSTPPATTSTPAAPAVPESFAAGRYHVRKFLGEGGKKRGFLAHDALLDRDVAFALIKTDGLDDVGRQRITREAQAMGRMGTHPHVVADTDRASPRVPRSGPALGGVARRDARPRADRRGARLDTHLRAPN